MIEEHQNFGLKGGTLKVQLSPGRTLAFALSTDRRWHEAEAANTSFILQGDTSAFDRARYAIRRRLAA